MAKVEVTQEVLDGLEAVRRSGRTNMFDRPVVVRLAEEMGYPDTARWVEANCRQYAVGIFRGFEAAAAGGEVQ